jgi:hypothetical protein
MSQVSTELRKCSWLLSGGNGEGVEWVGVVGLRGGGMGVESATNKQNHCHGKETDPL